MDVLVYADSGTSAEAVSQVLRTLKSSLASRYTIKPILASTLLEESWEGCTGLLVFPGGRDLPYCEALQPEGTDRIRRFVESGGKFLGLCAGAYFASAFVEFENGRPDYEVVGPRELKFFLGVCRGCVYPGFIYASEEGARAANLKVNGVRLRSYHNGGGFFDSRDAAGKAVSFQNVDVIGWYDEVVETAPMLGGTKQPAVVSIQVGKGTAVLSGAHLEYFSQFMHGHPLVPILEKTDTERRAAVSWILEDVLGLDLAKSGEASSIPSKGSP